jgi:hypothetical protein
MRKAISKYRRAVLTEIDHSSMAGLESQATFKDKFTFNSASVNHHMTFLAISQNMRLKTGNQMTWNQEKTDSRSFQKCSQRNSGIGGRTQLSIHVSIEIRVIWPWFRSQNLFRKHSDAAPSVFDRGSASVRILSNWKLLKKSKLFQSCSFCIMTWNSFHSFTGFRSRRSYCLRQTKW